MSTRCVPAACPNELSTRDKASSWLANCVVRREAWRRCSTWVTGRWMLLSGADCAISAQASTCDCSAASGVRSWWAASAMKRCWASLSSCARANRRFNASAITCTSTGVLGAIGMGRRSLGERACTVWASITQGIRALRAAMWAITPSNSSISKAGSTARPISARSGDCCGDRAICAATL